MDRLLAMNPHSFNLRFNDHKQLYAPPEVYYTDVTRGRDYLLVGEMDYTKGIWYLRVYMKTAIVFVEGFSNDLDELIDWAIKEGWS